MAFHVACPITCRRICYCTLGFPKNLQTNKAKNGFLDEIGRVENFLKCPWEENGSTVQVKVPKVVVAPPPPQLPVETLVGDGDELLLLASAQHKRAALQKRAAKASVVAEDYARRFESGDVVGSVKDLDGEEQGPSNGNAKVMCRLCFFGENEGSERARKMLSCKSCAKKYHRSCLKAWAQHRDLFHWSSWTCPSCRICEVCRRTGEPNKFKFCKRCDAAYHCYCQQPSHKNVSSGPYLCPKHTRCHSCESTVPGNGLSVRWFLGYTCCDACGRLFVKGNYCPVCLKVYRDSESTPMVCCDVCERWVHCQCDGISDEKYMQFQVDRNLPYRCATCRGECYQVRDLEDAVRELWLRKDEADRDLIASLRAAAGLPTQEEIFSISPYSDDEENSPTKNEFGRSFKLSLKGLVDKSPKKSKDYGKKSSNKKYNKKMAYQTSLINKIESRQSFEGHDNTPLAYTLGENKNHEMQFQRSGEPDIFSSPIAGSLGEGICSINQAGVLKHKFIDEVTGSNENRPSRRFQIKINKSHGMDTPEDIGKHASKSMTTKGPKLVIHIGARNKNATNSPRSDASSYQKEQELTTSNVGGEDVVQPRVNDRNMDGHDTTDAFGGGKGNKMDYSDQVKGSMLKGREGNLIKIKKVNSKVSDMNTKFTREKPADGFGAVSSANTRVLVGKRSTELNTTAAAIVTEVSASEDEKISLPKYLEGRPEDVSGDLNGDTSLVPSVSHSLPKDPKPLLKLKFKNPYSENQISRTTPGEEEKSYAKGLRSKRKRPSIMEKTSANEDEDEDASNWFGNTMDEMMDANWILQKLGKAAIGKRIEVHQSDNSWHRGTVTEVFEGTTMLSVALDNGKAKNLELGKQGIRFVSQKQRQQQS